MNQCFYCANGKVTTPPDVKSFEEFADCTTVACILGKKVGCAYCPKFKDADGALTVADKELLHSWGHTERDFQQIELAMQKSKTTYNMDGRRITRDEAQALLGRREWLSGISRSAFHYTAARQTYDGRTILFNSYALFK